MYSRYQSPKEKTHWSLENCDSTFSHLFIVLYKINLDKIIVSIVPNNRKNTKLSL